MADDDSNGNTTALAIKPDYIEKHERNRTELEAEITEIVNEVLESDIRLENTPEVREALRDYVRVEFLFSIKIGNAIKNNGEVTTADERMIRSLAKIKENLRDEVWQQVKASPGKDRSINITREQITKKIIKAQRAVDVLDK